jgi:2,5-diketo-D-gluconate reductase A
MTSPVAPVPTVALHNGVEMPVIGFGVYQIPADDTQAAVEAALAAGYRHLDTASSYGNEEAVGAAIRASGIARDDLWITTKLFIQHNPTGRVEDDTLRAFDRSLTRLGLDRIDLYLIHQPFGDYYAEWRALQEIYRGGRALAIGVSNFHSDRLVDLIDHNEIVPMVNQIETHPFHQRAADQDLMRERGVQIESWGPFAEGRHHLFTDPVLTEIAATRGCSVAQVVLRWLTQRGVVVIPKSVRPDRMAENLDIFGLDLTEDEMARVATLDIGASLFFDHRDPVVVGRLGNRRID